MKEREQIRDVETYGLTHVHEYGMKADEKSFKITIKSLYPDPARAIVREIWSNARDSHASAGKLDTPFECHLPDFLDPSFRVRDYGVSMTQEHIDTVYSIVFESSKDKDNLGVGKYGLGSKTPFAYCDSFTMTAFLDGEQRIYNSFINANGIPVIGLLTTLETDEPDGIEISFAVAQQDFDSFERAANQVIEGFDVKPRFVGKQVTFEEQPVVMSGDKWKMYGSLDRYHAGGSRAKMGCVIYPLLSHNFTNLDELEKRIIRSSVMMDFEIGDLNITPDRENLQYDTETVAAVRARVKEIAETFAVKSRKQVDSAKDIWELRETVETMRGKLPDWIFSSTVIGHTWASADGKKKIRIDSNLNRFRSNNKRVHNAEIAFYPFGSLQRDRSDIKFLAGEFVMYFGDDFRVYVQDTSKYTPYAGRRILAHARDNKCNVIWIKTPAGSSAVDRLSVLMRGRFKKQHIVMVDDIAYEKPKVKKERDPTIIIKGFSGASEYSSWNDYTFTPSEHLDSGKPNYYVDLYRGDVIRKPVPNEDTSDDRRIVDFSAFKSMKLALLSAGMIDKVVYGVPTSHKRVLESGKWVNVFDIVDDVLSEANLFKLEKFGVAHKIISHNKAIFDFVSSKNLVCPDGSSVLRLKRVADEFEAANDDKTRLAYQIAIIERRLAIPKTHYLAREFNTAIRHFKLDHSLVFKALSVYNPEESDIIELAEYVNHRYELIA